MRSTRTLSLLRALVSGAASAAALVGWAPQVASAQLRPAGITVQFMASRAGFTAPGQVIPDIRSFSPGHAFLCIAVPTNHGPKEDCLGFFKDEDSGVIAGSGVVLRGELASVGVPAIRRMSMLAVSLRTSISEKERREIFRLAESWNTRSYSLTDQSCIDFVVAAAQAAGLKMPVRRATDTPVDYLERLKRSNPQTN